jgi:trans-2,3-dihydro-3-hydroxyanthranilate isomerase
MGLKLFIVDVFAQRKYTGNQLGVILNSDNLSTETMQEIAREINFSETTFITGKDINNNGYNVRIFTPIKELPFAGHPTLGTAYIIQQKVIKKAIDRVYLNYMVGQIPVTINYVEESPDVLWMEQNSPEFAEDLSAEIISEVLNLELTDIDGRFPISQVSTGLPFIIVPLMNLDGIKKAKLNLAKYYQLIEHTYAKVILMFCPQTYHGENQLNVRVFTEYLGIPEDPATGSANGCLTAYLVKNRYFNDPSIDIRVEQGYEIARPSLLYLQGKELNGDIKVKVGGKVIGIAEGEWYQ